LAGQSKFFDGLVIFFADYLQYFLGIVFLAALSYSAWSRKEKIKIFLITALSMIISRFGIVELIRYLYHRPRPFVAYSVNQLVSNGSYSFPSGHAALFFAMAMAIYFYNKKWGYWFFIAAILMGAARVIAGVHYPTDILGGAAIGILSAYAVFYLVKKINYGGNN
jgi:undecaprenyl-diphosphatase